MVQDQSKVGIAQASLSVTFDSRSDNQGFALLAPLHATFWFDRCKGEAAFIRTLD